MLEQFLNHIQVNQLFPRDARVLLAVSGGLDSVVMAALFREAGFSFGIAHVNFQLRGEESQGDEAFVKALAGTLGVPCYVTHFDTQALADEHKLSIQMMARELRYAWFESLMKQEGYAHLATAHQQQDSVETVLMHWMHGMSLDGLTGIPVKQGAVIRPLLFASRDAIRAYALRHQLSWREDSSNASADYTRNFLRLEILPRLRQLNPSLDDTVTRGMHKLKGELALAHRGLQQWEQAFVTRTPDRLSIRKDGLSDPETATGVLYQCIRSYGFHFDVCASVIAALHGQSGKRFLSTTHQLVIDRDVLLVTEHTDHWHEVIIGEQTGDAVLGPWQLTMEVLPDVQRSADPFDATLDLDLLRFPLTWRRWRAGDFFYPLGMNHRKKVSDFLVDNKVPLTDKDAVTVLESDGEIIWVAGYRIDNRFRITPQTRRVVRFSLAPYFV